MLDQHLRDLARPTDDCPEYQVRKIDDTLYTVVLQRAQDALWVDWCPNEHEARKIAQSLNEAEGL